MEIHARRILLLGVLTAFAFGFAISAPICAQTPEKPAKTFWQLHDDYRIAAAAPCGQRDEAVRINREILARYGDSPRFSISDEPWPTQRKKILDRLNFIIDALNFNDRR